MCIPKFGTTVAPGNGATVVINKGLNGFQINSSELLNVKKYSGENADRATLDNNAVKSVVEKKTEPSRSAPAKPRAACEECRSCKVKCDRGDPCSRCKKRGLTCIAHVRVVRTRDTAFMSTTLQNPMGSGAYTTDNWNNTGRGDFEMAEVNKRQRLMGNIGAVGFGSSLTPSQGHVNFPPYGVQPGVDPVGLGLTTGVDNLQGTPSLGSPTASLSSYSSVSSVPVSPVMHSDSCDSDLETRSNDSLASPLWMAEEGTSEETLTDDELDELLGLCNKELPPQTLGSIVPPPTYASVTNDAEPSVVCELIAQETVLGMVDSGSLNLADKSVWKRVLVLTRMFSRTAKARGSPKLQNAARRLQSLLHTQAHKYSHAHEHGDGKNASCFPPEHPDDPTQLQQRDFKEGSEAAEGGGGLDLVAMLCAELRGELRAKVASQLGQQQCTNAITVGCVGPALNNGGSGAGVVHLSMRDGHSVTRVNATALSWLGGLGRAGVREAADKVHASPQVVSKFDFSPAELGGGDVACVLGDSLDVLSELIVREDLPAVVRAIPVMWLTNPAWDGHSEHVVMCRSAAGVHFLSRVSVDIRYTVGCMEAVAVFTPMTSGPSL